MLSTTMSACDEVDGATTRLDPQSTSYVDLSSTYKHEFLADSMAHAIVMNPTWRSTYNARGREQVPLYPTRSSLRHEWQRGQHSANDEFTESRSAEVGQNCFASSDNNVSLLNMDAHDTVMTTGVPIHVGKIDFHQYSLGGWKLFLFRLIRDVELFGCQRCTSVQESPLVLLPIVTIGILPLGRRRGRRKRRRHIRVVPSRTEPLSVCRRSQPSARKFPAIAHGRHLREISGQVCGWEAERRRCGILWR